VRSAGHFSIIQLSNSRENQEFQEKLRKIYLPEKNARVENYLRVVFEYHKVPLTDMAAVRRVIDKNQSGDKNTIYRSFTEAFGQKKGALYYGILKPHIRVIKRL
jgi:hypothetical protein